jgi:hypothetical protein
VSSAARRPISAPSAEVRITYNIKCLPIAIRHRRWLTTVRFDHPGQQVVLQDYIDAVITAEQRVARLTRQIMELMPAWSMAPVATAIQAMRGVAMINAVTIVAEVGDFARFENARQLMAYLGLVPSEHSSGIRVRRGGITKAGNAQARRALIEGAWTYRMQARVSRKLLDRLEVLPQDIKAYDTADHVANLRALNYRLQPDPHSQIADGLADSAHNHPVAPRVRRQKDKKSATLHVLQRTARVRST